MTTNAMIPAPLLAALLAIKGASLAWQRDRRGWLFVIAAAVLVVGVAQTR
ncbi:MAG: hypothetical protein NTZ09_03070 [Candidatus Hydrogenedentes bacterium]|nr:hypothetical protein [Candidatus Hydrogenedentota bacterium]